MSEIIGDFAFKEKPDMAQVFIRQLDRTNQAALLSSDPHRSSIYQTLSNLPAKWRASVYAEEERYKMTELTLMFKKFSGRRIGSATNPMLRDKRIPVKRLSTGEIDWSDPNIVSPTLQNNTVFDQQRFNEIVMEAAENAKLTWNVDELEVDAGDTLEHVERKKTPLWWRDLKREQDKQEDEDEAKEALSDA